jgi:molybdate transport system substrate-binding protein
MESSIAPRDTVSTCRLISSSGHHKPFRDRSDAMTRGLLACIFASVGLLVACGDTNTSRDELLVSAAASLADAFAEMEAAFEAENPGMDVVLNVAGSSALREQILEGAPVDVFASANLANMQQLEQAGELAGDPAVFARNQMQIAVPSGNPGDVVGLEDFSRDQLLIGLCAEPVPCGELAREVLSRAGVTPAVDTDEPDVRALVTKIELGELDAGIVYATDVADSGRGVEGVDIPEESNVAAVYSIAALKGTSSPDEAQAFVAFVQSERGQAILADYGFVPP